MVKKETVKEVGVIGGLIGVQIGYAGYSVLLSYLMSKGLDALTIVIFCTFTTFLLLLPPAILFERKHWPRSPSLKLITKLVLISFSGVTLFQTLFLEGMKHTSASIATAMPNLCPAFIFIIAWSLGMERVRLSCVYSRVKMGGTVLCVMGALIMSLMHTSASSAYHDFVFHMDKIVGCLYLLLAVLLLSANIILQASVLKEFPAPVSMCAAALLIGVIITAALRFTVQREADDRGPTIGLGHLIAYAFLGGVVNGGGVSMNGWAIKEKGPVIVSMFSPIATVVSVVLSALSLGENFNLPSMAGMALMFGGLYFVLWAKGKEDYGDEEELHQKPLLL